MQLNSQQVKALQQEVEKTFAYQAIEYMDQEVALIDPQFSDWMNVHYFQIDNYVIHDPNGIRASFEDSDAKCMCTECTGRN